MKKLILLLGISLAVSLFSIPMEDLAKVDSLRDINEYHSELEELTKLVEIYTNDYELFWRIAQAHFDIADQTDDEEIHKEHFYPGFEAAKMALELAPNSARANHWYAVLIGKIGILEGTKQKIINSYDVEIYGLRALELDPNYDGTLHLMGQWHYKLADLSWFERMIAGIVYETPPKASFEEADTFFRKAIIAKPDEVRHYLWLGKTLLKLKNKEDAKEFLQKTIEMQPLDDADKLMQKEAEKLLKKV